MNFVRIFHPFSQALAICFVFCLLRTVQRERERRARLVAGVHQRNLLPVHFHDALADAQSQPRAFAGRVRLIRRVEALKDVRAVFRRNAHALSCTMTVQMP